MDSGCVILFDKRIVSTLAIVTVSAVSAILGVVLSFSHEHSESSLALAICAIGSTMLIMQIIARSSTKQ